MAHGAPNHPRRSSWRRWVAASLLPLLASCQQAAPAATPPNVIVLLADTLRADRVAGSLGVMPYLDGFATRGTTFTRAYAPSSWTIPSVASLFTSRYPGQHGATRFATPLPPTETTLATHLGDAGYLNAAFSASLLLVPPLGLSQGFPTVEVIAASDIPRASGSAADVNAAALRWLDGRSLAERDRPVFLYLHYMDAHLPYRARPEYLEPRLLRHDDPGVARALVERAKQRLDTMLHEMSSPTFDPNKYASYLSSSAPGLRDLYDAEVGYLDAQLELLFTGLRNRGLLDNCIVVFTADHGEEIFEHGRFGHGDTLYEELVRVPLLVWTNPAGAAKRVDAPVSLVDVAPTVMAHVGAPIPAAFMGQPLPGVGGARGWRDRLPGRAAAADDDTPGRDAAFAELYPHEAYRRTAAPGEAPLRAVVLPQWKLITDPPRGRDRVFDLTGDAAEKKPLQSAAAPPPLRDALTGFVSTTQAGPVPAPTQAIDETTRERLRALGYAP